VWLFVPRVKPGKSPKLTPNWTGPFEVVRRALNDKVYYLKNEFGEELRTAVSLSRLKAFHEREDKPQGGVDFMIRNDITNRLLSDNAVSRVIRQDENYFDVDVEPEIEISDDDVLSQVTELGVQPDVVFEKPHVVKPMSVPLNTETKKLFGIGHEGVLSDDGKSIILKTRVAYEGKRLRTPTDRYIALVSTSYREIEDDFI